MKFFGNFSPHADVLGNVENKASFFNSNSNLDQSIGAGGTHHGTIATAAGHIVP